MKRIISFATLVVCVIGVSAFANMGAIGPSVTIIFSDQSSATIGPDILNPLFTQDGEVYALNLDDTACDEITRALNIQDKIDLTGLSFSYDEDPFVTGGISALNPTALTQTYTFVFNSPVAPPITPTSLFGGSMSGSFTAGRSVPATVATVALTPLYWGMIDGTPVLPIYSDPMSWSLAVPFSSGDIAAINIPTTTIGPAALNSISMQFKFTLTPDDIATMNGIFEVIPEPMTIALLGLGGLLLVRKKK